MIVQDTPLNDCFILQPKVYNDDRGYFMESFNAKRFEEKTGQVVKFVQDNEALSSYGVIRGLHAQSAPYAQAKLVRVVMGEVLDVVVDMRPSSSTYLQHFSIKLNASNKKQLWVPKGFYHGYAVLSPEVIFQYKCDAFYQPEANIGLRYNDPKLNIDWKIPEEQRIISEQDLNWSLL